MVRSKSSTAAAMLLLVSGVGGIALVFPTLAAGAGPQAGGLSGYLITVLAFVASILSIVAAYGTWMNMQRGKILGIVVNVLWAFLFLGAVLFASPTVKVVAGAILCIPILIIVLLLWRAPTRASA